MPYSTPSSPAQTTLPVHSNGRPGHRRSFSNAAPYAGAFQSLGSLPRARITPTSTPRFHIGSDNDDDDDSDDASDSPPPSKPDTPLKVKLPQSTIQFPRVSVTSPTGPQPVSFLERSTTTSPAPFTPPTQPQPRPAVARTTSSPIILLSNGKPLKSSLKSRSPSSSSTSLSTCSSTASLNTASAHTRAVSAPNTPHLDSLPSPVLSDDDGDGGRTPSTPKNVHFAPPDSLRNIRVFSRSAKPAAISSPGVETETETDGTGTESERFNWPSSGITWGSGKGRRRWNEYSNTAFPFPKIPPPEAMDVAKDKKPVPVYTLSPDTTPIPAPYRDPSANIHIESIKLVSLPPSSHPISASSEAPFSSSSPPMGHRAPLSGPDQGRVDLEGTVLVRNISFEKSVYIRFTLDGWQTTSEVVGHHVRSLSCLPGLPGMAIRQYAQSAPSAFHGGRVEWDRFEFKIPLSDYPRLEERTLWLVGRYVANHGEHWDNNRNENYKIQFEKRDVEDAMNAPTLLNGTTVNSGVVDPAPATQPESPPTPTGSRQRHSLAPLVTVPLTLPSLPRSVRRRQVESVDVDSDAESEHVPLKSNVDAPKVSTDEGSRERSGSLTSPEAVQVMQNALGKLNLKNYARPRSITSPSFFTPPSIATRLEPASAPKDDKSTVTFPPSPPQNEQPVPSGSNTSTPESSPVLSTPPLSRTTSDASKEVRWPWGESTVTSPTSPSQDPNKGYAALIQQWCFATTPDTRDRVEVA